MVPVSQCAYCPLCTLKLKNSNCWGFFCRLRDYAEIRVRLIALFLQNLNRFPSRHIRVVTMMKQVPVNIGD